MMDSIVRGHETGVMSRVRGALGAPTATVSNIATHATSTVAPLNEGQLKAFGRLVNVSTGRGYLPFDSPEGAGEVGRALNLVLLAPRYTVAPFEAIADPARALVEGNPAAAFESAKSLVAWLGTIGMTLKLAENAGAEVDADPTSSDFLKVKWGDTRYDFLGGSQQVIVFLVRSLALLKGANSPLGDVPDDWQHVPDDYLKTVSSFVRNKLHPGIIKLIDTGILLKEGMPLTAAEGDAKDTFNNRFGLVDHVAGLAVPLTPINILEAILDEQDKDINVAQELTTMLASFTGISTQTYGDDSSDERPFSRLIDKFRSRKTAPTPSPSAIPQRVTPGTGDKYSRP
jgi:hypothetical protein